MFTPIITRICSTEDDRGIYVKWTVPGRECPHYILGYIIAYKRVELDLNFSVRTLYGRNISSHVISTSQSSDEYEIKVAAIAPKEHGEFCQSVIWCGNENDENSGHHKSMVPIPKVTKIVPTKSGCGLAIHWEVTNDVSKFLIEGYLIAYKIASLDTEYKNRLVPGYNSNSHILKNLNRCTLYDVKLAAYTTTGSGGFSTPILIRTGASPTISTSMQTSTVPRFIPKITAIYPMSDPLSIYIRWTIPEDTVNPAILGYVISFKRPSCTDNTYIKCYLKGESSFCHVIRGVHQGHTYEVQVAAYNIVGEGKHSLPKLVKTCYIFVTFVVSRKSSQFQDREYLSVSLPKERKLFWCDNSSKTPELLQRQDVGNIRNKNLGNNSMTSPYINRQTFNDYQSLKNCVILEPDEAIKNGNSIKQRKKLTTINSCINKGGGRCKIQSDAHQKPSKSVRIRQQSAIKKGDNSFVNGDNDNDTPTIVLRYQHKSRNMPSNPLFQTNDSLTNPEHSFDSVDFVFQANRPEDLKLPSLNSLSSEVKQQSRYSETKKKEDNYGSFPRDHSWMQWDISNDSGKLHSIPEQGSDVLSFMRNKSYSYSESFESTSTTVSKKLNVDILCSDIYKRAYIAALKSARVRHFQHVPFECIITNPFVFSYFDFLCTKQRYKSNFTKKFDEMELIFGTVKVDDFIIK